LKFFNTQEEQNLIKTDQPEEIINVFRLIYLAINEDYSSIPPNKIIEILFKDLLPKYKVDCMKNLFSEYLMKKNDFSIKQIERMMAFVQSNPKSILASEIIKINKTVSYMCFVLKDIFDFFSLKYEDIYIYKIRDIRENNKILQEKKEMIINLKI